MTGRRAIVFGAAGMLGRTLVPRLEADGWHVRGVDVADGDVTDLAAVRSLVTDVALVVNCAAYTDVDGCETEQDTAFRVNAIGPRNLAIAAEDHGAPLVHVSTDFVFDGEQRTPYVEDDPIRPESVYGRSKAWGEQFVRDLCRRHFIIRTQWLYGHGGKNFVDTMRRLFGERDSVAVVADQIGSPTSTVDLSEGIAQMVAAGGFGTYHGACGGEVSWHGLAQRIAATTGYAGEVRETTAASWNAPAPRPAYSVLRNRHFELTIGDPFRGWEAALDEHLATA